MSGLGLSGLFKSLWELHDASSNQLRAVITQDNCQTTLLRPLIWNLLCTAVQCYISLLVWCNTQTRSINFSTSAGQLYLLVRSLQLRSATTVSPAWTTSQSQNLKFKGILRGQPTSAYWPQTKKSHIWDVLDVTKKYLAQDCLYQGHIHKTDADAIAQLEHDPSINWTAESYFMTKVK